MSSRAPASLRTSGLFSSVKQADDKEETSALAAAAAAASASAAAAASPEGGAARLGSGTCSPPCPPRPVSPRPNAAARNAALVRLHAAACHRSWAELPGGSFFFGGGGLLFGLCSPSLSRPPHPVSLTSQKLLSLARSLSDKSCPNRTRPRRSRRGMRAAGAPRHSEALGDLRGVRGKPGGDVGAVGGQGEEEFFFPAAKGGREISGSLFHSRSFSLSLS